MAIIRKTCAITRALLRAVRLPHSLVATQKRRLNNNRTAGMRKKGDEKILKPLPPLKDVSPLYRIEPSMDSTARTMQRMIVNAVDVKNPLTLEITKTSLCCDLVMSTVI
jgi:hypothetical protein